MHEIVHSCLFRVVIRMGEKAASSDADLVGQLGVVNKVEHSTSAVEVQLPRLGEYCSRCGKP